MNVVSHEDGFSVPQHDDQGHHERANFESIVLLASLFFNFASRHFRSVACWACLQKLWETTHMIYLPMFEWIFFKKLCIFVFFCRGPVPTRW